MARRYDKQIWPVPWNNPLRYITMRAENVGFASHQFLMKRRLADAMSLYRRDLKSHYGCVNAIEFSNDGLNIVSGKNQSLAEQLFTLF